MSGRESIVGTSPCDSVRWKHVLRGRLRGVECPKRVRTVRLFITTDREKTRFSPENGSNEKKLFYHKHELLTAWKSTKITSVFNHFISFFWCSTECPILKRFLWFPDCLISRIRDDTFMIYES